jgi:hypothetical protein
MISVALVCKRKVLRDHFRNAMPGFRHRALRNHSPDRRLLAHAVTTTHFCYSEGAAISHNLVRSSHATENIATRKSCGRIIHVQSTWQAMQRGQRNCQHIVLGSRYRAASTASSTYAGESLLCGIRPVDSFRDVPMTSADDSRTWSWKRPWPMH